MEPKPRSGEFQNGQTLFDAYAVAKRSIDEGQRHQRMMFELSGQPEAFSPPPAGINELMAATTAYQLVDLIEGYPPRTINQYFEEAVNALSDGALRELVFEDFDEEIDLEAFRELLSSFLTNLKDFAGIKDIDTDKTLRLYRSAVELSKLKDGISVEDIFKDDQSYEELVRHTFTPSEFVSNQIEMAEKITPESIADLVYKSTLAAMHFVASIEGEELTQEDLEEMNENRNSLIFQQEVSALYRKLRKAYGRIVKADLERFWGQNATAQLTSEMQSKIEDLCFSTEDIHEFRIGEFTFKSAVESDTVGDLLEKRASFVQRYCEEKGLDPNNLSFEQILEIRNLPEWKNPE